MEDELLELLKKTRADYEAECLWHRFLRDAYAGTGGFQGKVRQPQSSYWGPAASAYAPFAMDAVTWGPDTDLDSEAATYLDKYGREDAPKFRTRRAIAHYSNFVEPIVDLRNGHLFRKAFTREGVEPLADWLLDVDGLGTDFDVLRREAIALNAAIVGWVPTVIDRPLRSGAEPILTAAQEEELGMRRPRLAVLWPHNLLDWATEGNQFLWAKVRTDHCSQPDPLGPAETYARFTLWTRAAFRVIEWKTEAGKMVDSGLRFDSGWIEHDRGRVPIRIARYRPVPGDPVRGLSMIGAIAIANRRHFNVESELDEHIRSQVFAILQIATKNPDKLGEVLIGTDNALAIDPDSSRDHKFIAPPESVSATLETRLQRLEATIYRLAREEYRQSTGATGNPASGTSRRYEFAQTNQALADFASRIAAWERDTLGDAFELLDGDRATIQVAAPTDFDVEALEAEVKNALDAVSLGLGPTATAEIKRRLVARLLPSLTSTTKASIDEEIDEAAERERQASSFEAEAAAAAAGKATKPDDEEPDDEGVDDVDE